MLLLTINRDTLLKPLTLVTGFVEKKQTMPILSNLYIKKNNNGIVIIASDLEIQASVSIEEALDGQDFTITLPGRKLQDILKVFANNIAVKLFQEDSKIIIKGGKTKYTLQSLPFENYPLLKIHDLPSCSFSLEQIKLKNLIGQVQYAMADKDSRVFLNGMLFEIKDNQLHLVATDAHRLAYAATEIDVTHNANVIIPRKTILELYRLLEDKTDLVSINIYSNQVCFKMANKELITKVIDGKYPDYERVIPLDNDKIVLINRLNLLRAVERVGIIGIDKLKNLCMELTQNNLLIYCKNEDQEDSRDEIEVHYDSLEKLNLSFNIQYIRELLSNNNNETLQWAFLNNHRSVLVTVANELNFKAVIMPLRT